MYWAQFFNKTKERELIPACGDRAVIVLDGRERLQTRRAIAQEACKARGYGGYQLMKGDTFTRSEACEPPVSLIY